MLVFVFAGCSATGPFQPHSAFKQAVLPSGYQSAYQNQSGYQNQTGYGTQGAIAPQWQSSNYPPQYGNGIPAYGYGATPQPTYGGYGYGGQVAYPQNNQGYSGGVMSPFVGSTYSGGNYTSGSC